MRKYGIILPNTAPRGASDSERPNSKENRTMNQAEKERAAKLGKKWTPKVTIDKNHAKLFCDPTNDWPTGNFFLGN